MELSQPVAWAVALCVLIACCSPSAIEPSERHQTQQTPPPVPDGRETVAFERQPDQADIGSDAKAAPEAAKPAQTVYWGVKDGEPLTILWEDLMPEGSEEELMREYEEFYAMLEKRYAANTQMLSDADPYAMIEEGSELDFMPQLGGFETVEELNDEYIRIPGYVVPFDFNSKMRQQEFLFVPYMGACIHSPPPAPNQIILIRADPPVRVKDIWVPYWIEGTLTSEVTENDLANTAYSMQMSSIEPYPMP